LRVFLGIFFAILILAVVLIAIDQHPSSTPQFVSVTGVGTTTVVPDAERLSAGAPATSSSSAVALAATSKSAQTFRHALKSAGVLAKYMQTQTLTVTPNYTHSQSGGSKILGY